MRHRYTYGDIDAYRCAGRLTVGAYVYRVRVCDMHAGFVYRFPDSKSWHVAGVRSYALLFKWVQAIEGSTWDATYPTMRDALVTFQYHNGEQALANNK